jgi:hypothetical protein
LSAPSQNQTTYSGLINNTYGSQTSPNYNPTTNSYLSQTPGNPTWNGSSWVSSTTGQPFTGTYLGQSFNAGQSYQQMANNPNSRYASVNIAKNPGVLAATNNLTSTFQPTQGITDFSDLLNASRSAQSTATSGLASDQNAINLDPLTTTLNNLNAGYANTTSGLNTTYSNILGNQADTTASDIAQANQNLDSYDTAAQNVADAEQNALQAQVSRYKLGTGTPSGLGGGEESLIAQGVQNIQLPTQLAKTQAAQQLLQGYVTPLQQQLTQAQIGQLTGFTAPMAQQNYQNSYNTATQLQNLKLQTAGMSIADATNYMKAMAVPDQTIQQILATNQGLNQGNISTLGGLNSLYGGSQYQGLQDLFGANPSQPTTTTFNPGGAGAYPTGSRYSGVMPGGGYPQQPQQPQQPAPAQAGGGNYGSNYSGTNAGMTSVVLPDGTQGYVDSGGNYYNANQQYLGSAAMGYGAQSGPASGSNGTYQFPAGVNLGDETNYTS